MPETITYLFVDGGYIKKAFADSLRGWFGDIEPQIEFNRVIQFFSAQKMFYYDCEDKDRRSTEDDVTFQARLREQDHYFNSIREIPGSHVRLGHLIISNGKRRRQKEVDIRLTVDMMNHAVRRNMTKAILLAGDRDFRPLVEGLVDLGVNIVLAADEKSVSLDLAYAADQFIRLGFETYHDWTTTKLRQQFPIDVRYLNGVGSHIPLIRSCFLRDRPLQLLFGQQTFFIHMPSYRNGEPVTLAHKSEERLLLYTKLKYGDIRWD